MTVKDFIPLACSVVAIIISLFARGRDTRHDIQGDAMERATITADLRYIRDSIDDFKVTLKSQQNDINQIRERLSIIEHSAKSAHKRLDEMQKG